MFEEGQKVTAKPGKYLPFSIGTVTHIGRSSVGVVADGKPYLVNPGWLSVVKEGR